MMDLHIELLQHFTKKSDEGKTKAIEKVILEDNSVILTGQWDNLALRTLSPALRDVAILLKLKDHLLGHE
jgi:hypothetical protein